MRKILLLTCYLLGVFTAWSQQQPVTGKVTDESDGTGLPGVSILVKGTGKGTVSDSNGNYSIDASADDILVYSFIGYNVKEELVGQRKVMNIALVPSITSLSEIVVIGYGEREKKDLTGSISAVSSKELEKSISVTPELAMQGRMTGVFVSSPGGNPNARPVVRVRGQSTFRNADPLFVVDGVPIIEFGSTGFGVEGDIRGNINVLATINPGDIESISVLKDAAASAIYGARAANGVVLITTKRGKKGEPTVEFNASRGVQSLPNKYEVLNTAEFTSIYQEMFDNDYLYRTQQAPNADPANPYIWDVPGREYLNVFNPASADPYYGYLGNSPTYDWQSELINKGSVVEDYSARVSGGTESSSYYIGGGYSRTESPLIQNYLERYSLTANVRTNISKKIETGVLYRVSYTDALDNTSGNLEGAARVSPWQPIYDPNDPTGFARSTDIAFVENPDFDLSLASPGAAQIPVAGSDQLRPWGNESNQNYFGQMAYRRTDYQMLKNFGTGYLQVEPVTGFKIKGSLSVDWLDNRRNDWDHTTQSVRFSETPGNPYAGQDGTAVGTYRERHTRNVSLLSDLTLSYSKSFNDHKFDVLVSASNQDFKYEFISGQSPQQFAEERYRGIGGDQRWNSTLTLRSERAIQGYVGRVSYSYADKYFVDASIRRDGSSDYPEDYRWGTFPGVSAAWRISNENFFQQNVSFMDDLKLRVGYGSLGNTFSGGVGFAPFVYLSTVGLSPDYSVGSGPGGTGVGTQVPGAFLPQIPNRTLTWETAKTFNAALDGSTLNGNLTFTVEYYNKTTEGIQQSVSLPLSSGVSNTIDINVATVRNSGVELELGYGRTFGDLKLNLGGNFTTVRNRVIALYRNTPIFGNGLEIGQPVGYIYGYKVGGVFQSQEEIDQWRANYTDLQGANQQPGDMWFQDVYGNPTAEEQFRSNTPDGLVNQNDRTNIGKTIPGFFYGANINANYKNFDLSVFFQGVGDVYKYNAPRNGGEQMDGTGLNFWTSTRDRWTPENPSSTMPRAVFGDPNGNNRFSDRWVEKASFMRLKNVQLGYTLPAKVLESLKVVKTFRIYVSGTNLFTITNWTGLDPENDFVPPTRVLSMGVNASF